MSNEIKPREYFEEKYAGLLAAHQYSGSSRELECFEYLLDDGMTELSFLEHIDMELAKEFKAKIMSDGDNSDNKVIGEGAK